MLELIITNLLTLVCGSGVTCFATLKYQRKEAEATALEHVQSIYRTLTDDLRADRDQIKEERDQFKAELDQVKSVISDLKTQMTEMALRVSENERRLESQRPYACRRARTCRAFEGLTPEEYTEIENRDETSKEIIKPEEGFRQRPLLGS